MFENNIGHTLILILRICSCYYKNFEKQNILNFAFKTFRHMEASTFVIFACSAISHHFSSTTKDFGQVCIQSQVF